MLQLLTVLRVSVSLDVTIMLRWCRVSFKNVRHYFVNPDEILKNLKVVALNSKKKMHLELMFKVSSAGL